MRAYPELHRRSTAGRSRPSRPAGSGSHRPAAFLELEHMLGEYLSTGVSVKLSAQRGQVVIDFATLDDLERIYRLITRPQPEKVSITH